MLSHLCRHVITSKTTKLDIEPIFPSKDSIDADYGYATLPNQFLAIIKSDNPNIKEEINNLKNLVENEFCTIAEKASNDVLRENSDTYKIFRRQIKDFFNIFWVALPMQDDNYAENFSDIGKYLGSIKNTRNFHQSQEDGRKCSLCGERNVLFYRENEFEKKKSHDIIKKNKLFNNDAIIIKFENHNPVSLKNLQTGEGLCTVCYTKRCINKYFEKKSSFASNFPSTAKIALLDAIPKLNNENIKKFTDVFEEDFDDQLYYEDNLTAKYFNKYGYPEDKLDIAKRNLATIYNDAKNRKIHLSKYYAIIILDGDDIGKWLSGSYLQGKTNLENFHNFVANELFKYAKNVQEIIKDSGRVVYSGGDDTLAFVNLNDLLNILNELRHEYPKFETSLNHKIKNNHESSVSCGVCIAHYKYPLSEALTWARKIAKEAKEIDTGKDAVAIALMMRSGEIRKTCFKSKYLPLLEELVTKLKTHFSDKFIYSLREELLPLYENVEIEYDNISVSHEMIESELKRLTLRGRRSEIDKDKFLEDIEPLLRKIKPFITSQFIGEKNEYSFSVVNFMSFLEVARFLFKECLDNGSDST